MSQINQFFLDELPDQEKKNQWDEKKYKSAYLSNLMQLSSVFSESKMHRTENCANHIFFNSEVESEKIYLEKAYFCRYRACPLCIWRKSLKAYSQMSTVFENIENNYKYVFLTLTIKNCAGEDLKHNIDVLLNGFKLFNQRLQRAVNLQGFYRSLEITKNKTYKTFHPHIHVLLVLPDDYFTNKLLYKKTKWFSEIWAECCNLNYNPICDARKVSHKTDSTKDVKALQKALLEITKYPIKDNDLFYYNYDSNAQIREDLITLETLDNALQGRRLISFGGVLEQLRRKLKLDDLEDGDLILKNDASEHTYVKTIGFRYLKKYRKFCEFEYQSFKPLQDELINMNIRKCESVLFGE